MSKPYLGCMFCKHLNSDARSCKAFPERIPLSIMSGEIQHTERIRGQATTIVYETDETVFQGSG